MRVARQTYPGVAYHLIWRFVDRHWFFEDDDERRCYLRLLGHALTKSDWSCLAYALMSNHIHMAVVAGASPLESWSKAVNSPFVRWMNDRHGRLGPLIADRPKAGSIRQQSEAKVIAYIHNNPVRAGLVKVPNDSDVTWTSHRYYSGMLEPPPWLHAETAARRTGLTLGPKFDAWVQGASADLGEADVSGVRKYARRRGAIEVATPHERVVPLVRRPFGKIQVDPRQLVHAAADITGVPYGVLTSRSRTRNVTSARLVAVHAADSVGICGADIASALGLSPGAVCHIRARVPNAREATAIQSTVMRLGSF